MEIIKKVFRSSIDKETQQFKIEKTNRDKADYPWYDIIFIPLQIENLGIDNNP